MSKAVKTEYVVKTDKLRDTIKIAHISDLHERRADDILAMLRETKPDLIAVTGDTFERYDEDFRRGRDFTLGKRIVLEIAYLMDCFFDFFSRKLSRENVCTENSREFLSEAVKLAPVFLSLGNHEEKLLAEDMDFLDSIGVVLLDNTDVSFKIKNSDLNIGGMSSYFYETWFEKYKRGRGFKLLLCHHPERFKECIAETDIDLTLSGHTHGGQVRVGKRGLLVPNQGLFSKLAHGIFFGGRLIISAGCSNTVSFPRLGNPRELVIITVEN